MGGTRPSRPNATVSIVAPVRYVAEPGRMTAEIYYAGT